MARSTAPIFTGARNILIAGVVACLCYGAYVYMVRFGNLDPFSQLKGANPLGATTLRIDNVDLHAYHKGRLQMSAQLKRVDVGSDRNSFDLLGVKNGVYYGPDGKVQFAADQGNWNGTSQKLSVFGGVRAQGKQFDLQTSAANFDRKTEKLQVPLPVSGRLYGGTIQAANLNYDMRTEDARTGPLTWQGKPSADTADQLVTPRTWSITSGPFSQHGSLQTFEHARATDGEVLVFAPHVERDSKTDVLTATGRVTYFSGKADVIADKVVVYRKEKRAVFTGHVDMLVKPKKDQDQPPKEEEVPTVSRESQEVKPDTTPKVMSDEDKKRDEELRSGKTLRDYPLSITAEAITYWYGKGSRHAIVQGAPVANQKFTDGRWRKGWAHDGYYDGEKDTLELKSTPGQHDTHLTNSIGDIYKATSLLLSTKEDQPEDEEDISGVDVDATLVDRSGQDEREPKKPTSTPTPGASPTKPPKSTTPPAGGGTGTTGGTTTGG